MQANKVSTIKITVDSPAYGGLAVGRVDGRAVLVRGAIAGETVEAEIIEEKKIIAWLLREKSFRRRITENLPNADFSAYAVDAGFSIFL